jgi:hypothetical protein
MSEQYRLRCFGGRPPPQDVVLGVAKFLALPVKAKGDFWSVLAPCIPEALSSAANSMLEHFAKAHGVEGVDVARAVRGSRVLVRAASAEDLTPELFAQDLLLLARGDESLAEVLLKGYGRAKALVRGEIAKRVLAEHGKTLDRVSWRMDIVACAEEASTLALPVGVMTLHYRDREKKDHLTLQLSLEDIQSLAEACSRMLNGPQHSLQARRAQQPVASNVDKKNAVTIETTDPGGAQ